MKKQIKKTILAILTAAMLMVPFITMSAFAAEAPGGLPPDTGNLYIHKYIGEKISSNPHDGTELSSTDLTGRTPANNVVYNLYLVGGPIDDPDGDLPKVPPIGTYTISKSPLKLVVTVGGNDIEYSLEEADTASITTGVSGTPVKDGVAVATDLPQGIYVVEEDLIASQKEGVVDSSGHHLYLSTTVAPFLVAVPMTNVDGDGWLVDVHVYPKSEELSITKEVNPDDLTGARTVAVGDTVSYKLTSSIPGDIETGRKYEITDILDEALTLELESVAVSTINEIGLEEDTDYTINHEGKDNKLTISFTEAGLSKLAGLKFVVVDFDCTVNDEILGNENYTISNTAEVEFVNEEGDDFIADSEEDVDVHTAAIEIAKVDENGNALAGAVFKIATSEAKAKAGNFLRQDPVTKVLYDFEDPKWATLEDYQVTSADVSGIALFEGLRDFVGAAEQTYFIVETEAPAGYNLLAAAIEVTFEGDEEGYIHLVTVENSKGFTLPITGGMGTIIFTVAGIVLMGVACIAIITRKKRAAESQ